MLARPYFADGGPGSILAALAQVPELLEVAAPFVGAALGPSAGGWRRKEIVIVRTWAGSVRHRVGVADRGSDHPAAGQRGLAVTSAAIGQAVAEGVLPPEAMVEVADQAAELGFTDLG